MVWTSGVIGDFSPKENLYEKLRKFKTTREERGFTLQSIIQLEDVMLTLEDGVDVITGMVIDEYVREPRRLEKVKEDIFTVVKGRPHADVRFGTFWMTTKSIIIVDRSANREFVFGVISKALGGGKNSIRPVGMDIKKIAKEYKGHWLGSIVDRKGNMTTGTFYGTDLEDDDVIGSEYKKSHKNQVGFVTQYFQSPTKVRVTRGGGVTVFAGVTRENYIQFIREELLGYVQPITKT